MANSARRVETPAAVPIRKRSNSIEPSDPNTIARRRISDARRRPKQRALNLSGLGLTGLPPEIAQLTTLQSLDLSNNQLTGLPPEIAQLTTLQSLDLSNNQLTGLPPEIAQLTALQSSISATTNSPACRPRSRS